MVTIICILSGIGILIGGAIYVIKSTIDTINLHFDNIDDDNEYYF